MSSREKNHSVSKLGINAFGAFILVTNLRVREYEDNQLVLGRIQCSVFLDECLFGDYKTLEYTQKD